MSAAALSGILFAPLARTVLTASAEDPIGFLNRQQVHWDKIGSTGTLARVSGDGTAGAIILAVAHIVACVLVRSHNCVRGYNNNQKS
jgi:hypothetical protein